jgi:outer membrane protein assembly factor BamE (lipoprotein component of BamABCDE complex)
MGFTTSKALCVAGMIALGAGCAPIERFHGFLPSEAEVARLQVGTSTKTEAIALFGPPIADRALNGDVIYYATSQFRTFGPFAPQIVDREVLAVSFDSNQVLTDVARYTLADGRVVRLDRRVTEDGIRDVTFLGQLLSSFGRLDAGTLLGEQ